MKILLVSPRFPDSLWSFRGINELVGIRCAHAPLGLATVAALTPPQIQVELQDENCRALDFGTDADVVAIGCWNVQYGRAREVAAEFRRRGVLVAVGGPYPTLCPERFGDDAFDVVFEGEAEITWRRFCEDLARGSPRPRYVQDGNVDMSLSPVPRYDLLSPRDYLYFFVQTTRGCPYQCEFCDIIVTDGRRPRQKSIPQVLEELETIADLGGRFVTFSDPNFIGDPRYAEQLLVALAEFGRARGFPIHLSAEMTLNVADRPRLLELMARANLGSIFVGIESPRADSLIEGRKRQNLRRPLLESVRRIQSHDIVIVAGMIVGFDHDDVGIFQEQFDFLMEAGIPYTTCGTLTAIEKTPLHARLEKEGRLLPNDSSLRQYQGVADVNFIPGKMGLEELQRGYSWLVRALYRPEHFGARLVRALEPFHRRPGLETPRLSGLDAPALLTLARTLRYYLLSRSHWRRRFFLRTLRDVLATGPSLRKLVEFLAYAIVYKHFREFASTTHGPLDHVGPVSPFAGERRAEAAQPASPAGPPEGSGRADHLGEHRVFEAGEPPPGSPAREQHESSNAIGRRVANEQRARSLPV